MHVHEGHGPPRVLLGNLEPVVKLGMTAVLEEDGIEVIGEESRDAALVLMAGRMRPDAVVLDLLGRDAHALGGRVQSASPDTKVLLWARDEDELQVLDPGAKEPRRLVAAAHEELRSELRIVRSIQVEE